MTVQKALLIARVNLHVTGPKVLQIHVLVQVNHFVTVVGRMYVPNSVDYGHGDVGGPLMPAPLVGNVQAATAVQEHLTIVLPLVTIAPGNTSAEHLLQPQSHPPQHPLLHAHSVLIVTIFAQVVVSYVLSNL